MENEKNGVIITAEKFIKDLFQGALQIENLDEVLESAAFANAAGESILLRLGNDSGYEDFQNTMVIDGGIYISPAVWADIRYDQSHHCLPYAKELAIAIAKKSLTQYPTALVDTGTSIQAYWFFSDDLEILEHDPGRVVVDSVRTCQDSIRTIAELVGLQISEPYYDQPCGWLADHLMLPGFVNHDTIDKKKVECIFNSDKRYSVYEFEYLMNPIQKHSKMANGLLKKYGNLFESLILNEIGEEVVVSGQSCNTKKEKVED